MKVLVPVFVTNGKAKRKLFRENQEVAITLTEDNARLFSLGMVDVFSIVKVETADGLTDLTDNYVRQRSTTMSMTSPVWF